MYSITKLSEPSKQFLQSISVMANTALVEASVAKAIANRLQLPSSPVNDTSDYYVSTILVQARVFVGQINELRVFDVQSLLNQVRTMWLCRYNILYPKSKIYLIAGCDADEHFFGFAPFLTKQLDEAINANLAQTINCLNGFTQIFDDLNAVESQG